MTHVNIAFQEVKINDIGEFLLVLGYNILFYGRPEGGRKNIPVHPIRCHFYSKAYAFPVSCWKFGFFPISHPS